MITIVVGSSDSGKELLLAYLITLEAKSGRKVYSNMNITIPHEDFDFPAFSEAINSGTDDSPLLNNCIIGLKDAWRLINSKRFNSNDNKLFSWFIYQMRKRNVSIILETDRFERIDLRVRKSCDVKVICKSILFGDILYRLESDTRAKVNRTLKVSVAKEFLNKDEWAKRY